LTGAFCFSLRSAGPETVSGIWANVPGVFNAANSTFTISTPVTVPALLVRTRRKTPISSLSYCSGQCLSITAFLPAPPETPAVHDVVFIVDCSGSMRGNRIGQARFCLDLFIRSLPENSFFNVVRFGSSFELLFPRSQRYEKESVEAALAWAKSLEADLRGTELLHPMEAVFRQPLRGSGNRQVFVITDGEVSNTDAVIDLVRRSSAQNRCFTIGLGKGADAGLVEGIADASGGQSDFVASERHLGRVVISQLEKSLQSCYSTVSVHVGDHDGIEVTPFPVPSLFPGVAKTLFVRDGRGFSDAPQILLSAFQSGQAADFVIPSEVDRGLERALSALFAYETIARLEGDASRDPKVMDRCIMLSIESGVLCRETAFVGFSETIYKIHPEKDRRPRGGICSHSESDDDSDDAAYSSDSDGWPPAENGPASAPAPPAPARRHAPPGILFRKIVEQQDFGGWWGSAEALLALVKGKLPSFNDAALATSDKRDEIIATIVALGILRSRCAQDYRLWKLIEKKAITWLQGQKSRYDPLIS
jgi:hypothetical protein